MQLIPLARALPSVHWRFLIPSLDAIGTSASGLRSTPATSLARVLFCACIVAAVALRSDPGMAQQPPTTTFQYQQRALEEQLRPLIQPDLRTAEVQQRFQYDYGGMLRYTVQWFEDHGPPRINPFTFGTPAPLVTDFQGSRTLNDWDFRPWLSASLDGVHFAFIRGQLDFLQYGSGDSYTRNSDWRGPFVDLGFYRLDLDEAGRVYHGQQVERWAADLSVGRQFLFLGRGTSFALVTDALSLDWSYSNWSGLVFGSQSVRHYDNIDRTVAGFTRSDRAFFGAELEYQALDHHRPYAYVLVQRDRSDESPRDPFQEYDYDSEYWGLGIAGEALFGEAELAVGIANLRYFGEIIIERGDSFPSGSVLSQEPIRSWAVDTGLVYYVDCPTRPRFLVQFARGSGDEHRRSANNTAGGNLAGTTDRGFLGFGFVNTGYSFAPLLSNLQFVRLAGAFRPLEGCCPWRSSDLELGSSFFWYWRPEEDGGVSDLRVDMQGDDFLGSEIDLFVNWRVSSDLYLLLNYAVFWPNDGSFSLDRSRQFLTGNLTWLF